MTLPLLSVVIPLRDEIALLDEMAENYRLLASAAPQLELIFVDGRSQDGSLQWLEHRGYRVVSSPPGRARQMNAGAGVARGEMLLFLHADTRISPAAIAALMAVAAERAVQWGRFDVAITGDALMFPVIAFMMNWRSRLTGIATGDMGIFVRRPVFEQHGAFPDQPLMEDIELSKVLRRVAPPCCLRQRVLTSGRRWQQRGLWTTIMLMWRLRAYYFFGVSASRLARWYR